MIKAASFDTIRIRGYYFNQNEMVSHGAKLKLFESCHRIYDNFLRILVHNMFEVGVQGDLLESVPSTLKDLGEGAFSGEPASDDSNNRHINDGYQPAKGQTPFQRCSLGL
jgi:hypothetical protein